MLRFEQVATVEQIEAARTLFRAYAGSLEVDLAYQDFAAEVAELPGVYAPPRGRLQLLRMEERAAGCVALKPLAEGICEMKRLFVHPDFRGRGLGRRLAEEIIAQARSIGYARMRLDSLPSMEAAQELYRALGFRIVPPYYDSPVEGTVFMELALSGGSAHAARKPKGPPRYGSA